MIIEGTWVWSKAKQSRGKVIEVAELWGTTQLRIWLPKENVVLVHSPDEVDLIADQSEGDDFGATEGDVRFAAVLGKVASLINDDKLLAPLDSNVTPLPHQIKVLKKVLSGQHARFLLADEVGLGKTIEAGLAIKELKMRGRVQRVLVVAPKGLIPQWIVEMQERFGETFRFFEPSNFEGFREMSGEDNVWRSCDQVICSMDAVKPIESRRGWSAEQLQAYNQDRILDLSAAGWDLVIIDEAHRVAGSADTVARYAMARMLAESTPNLLLLSATPHQGKSESFHRLMKLIDKEAFPDDGCIDRNRVEPYIARTEKRNAIDHRGEPLFTPRLTSLIPVSWRGHTDQEALYEAVTGYVRGGYNQAQSDKNTSYGFLMILMQRLVTSSTAAITATLERRLNALKAPQDQLQLFTESELIDLGDLDGESQVDAVLKKQIKALKNESAEVELLYTAAKRVMARGPDAKAEALLETIYRLQQDETDPELKILIFTEFVPTQRMLAEYLEQAGFSVVCLNGSMNMKARKATQKAFSEDARIMVSTDAGGEGLNLQFCHIIINFDLGWRPMALEQRIGRVDRIGQKHVVKALNFVLEDSVEFRVREVLEAKLAVIFEEFGIDKTSDVLDSEGGAHIFDKLFVDALLQPKKIESDVESVLDVVRQEAAWNKEQLNVLGQGELDASLEDAISTQPLSDYLDIMVRSHVESGGGAYKRSSGGANVQWPGDKETKRYSYVGDVSEDVTELLTLDHPRIRKLLSSVPRVHAGDRIPSVEMDGLPGAQGGFWSLWQLRFATAQSTEQVFFPLFTNADGRSFDRTAHFIWDSLLNQPMQGQGRMAEGDSLAVFDQHQALAQQIGEPLFGRLKNKHEQNRQQRERNGRYHFEVRFKQLNQVGLPEVRQFRQRQLELEQETWRQEMQAQATIHPELNPLIILDMRAPK